MHMKVLFLTISDQQCHPLNEYSDLHRTYDFISWEAGFKAIHQMFASLITIKVL